MPAQPSDEGPGLGPRGEAGPAGGGLPDGLMMSWSGDVPLEEILAAARRQMRQLAGGDVPAWGEPGDQASGDQEPDDQEPSDQAPGDQEPGDRDPGDAHGADTEDPFGDDELLAVELATSSAMSPGAPGAVPADVLPVGALAGHARLTPGPVLAGWLSGSSSADLDDAALVSSVTGWRKVTSWAQAQELAAVAELGRRRGVTCEVAPERAPAEELAAVFAPDEVALALTLTQCAADYWMSLAVSLATRLPGTLTALRTGSIDLGRAKLIDQFTTPLEGDLARKVEDRVLAKAPHQTTGQLRASLQRAVISVDPEAAERRRKQAERNARVELAGEPEGTASLFGRYLPAALAAAAWARVSAIAKALEKGGAAGGIDLLRAQVFIRLLLGAPLVPPGAPEPSADGPLGPAGPSGSDCPAGSSGSGPGGPDPSGGDPPDVPSGPGPGTPESHNGAGPGPSGVGGDGGGVGGDGGGAGPGGGAEPNGGAGRNGGVGPSGGARPGRRGPGGEPSSGAGPTGGPGWPGAWPGIPSLGELPGLNGEALSDGATAELLKGRPKLSVSWRTLAGLSGEPGLLGRIGPVAATVARDLAAAAVADQTCEWRIIVVGARGQPLAVRRIRSPGRSGASSSGPPVRGPLSQVIVRAPTGCLSEVDASRHRFRSNGSAVSGSRAGGFAAGGSGAGESGSTGLPAALQRILAAAAACDPGDDTSASSTSTATTQPGGTQPGGTQPGGTQPGGTHASGACAHARSGAGYRVPPRLRAFVEARDQDCGFPPCRRAAASCDMDHTIPYHLGGLTCECNLGPRCRRHHRMKGCGMWRLEQARSGVLRWTGPAGLTYMSAPEPLMA